MDLMQIIDIFTIGVVETILILIISLIVCKGRLKQEFIQNKLLFTFKMIISTFGILFIIYFSRSRLNNIATIGYISLVAYIITYKLIWTMNWRASLLAGSIAIFLIIIAELGTYPCVDIILFNLKDYEFYQNRFLLSMPSRIFEIIILLLIIKFRLTLSHLKLVKEEWCNLTKSNKITITLIIGLILICMVCNLNYQDMFMKSRIYKIDTSIIDFNLKIYFLATIVFTLIVLILLNRTARYETFKEILSQEPCEISNQLFNYSTKEEREVHFKQLLNYSSEEEKIVYLEMLQLPLNKKQNNN